MGPGSPGSVVNLALIKCKQIMRYLSGVFILLGKNPSLNLFVSW